MTWFLIVINLNGGQPAFIPMESEHACMMASAAMQAQTLEMRGTRTGIAVGICINTVEV